MKIGQIRVPDGKSANGMWEISTVEKKEETIRDVVKSMQTGRYVPKGTYRQLFRIDELGKKTLVMSNTPDECNDFVDVFAAAEGHVFIAGLGMGTVVEALLHKPEVTKITIVEISQELIDFVGVYYKDEPRVEIIHGDAREYTPPEDAFYGAAWFDIWDTISEDNIEEMDAFETKFEGKSDYMESWARSVIEDVLMREQW